MTVVDAVFDQCFFANAAVQIEIRAFGFDGTVANATSYTPPTSLTPPHAASSTTSSRKATRSEQRIPLNQNRRVTGTTEILELCKDMLRLEHGIGNDFDMGHRRIR